MSGKWLAAGAAFLLLAAACAPPKNTITFTSPTPSPSPTPTTPLAMTGPTFHVGEVGVAYAAVSYSATGGVQPYHWAVTAGSLPGGLTLGSDGSISGAPTTPGDFSFTIGVADSGDSNQTATGKISIAAALSARLIPACANYCNVELGCVNACGNFGTLGGGVGPYGYTVTRGPLPAGTSLAGLSLTGTFRGSSGYLQFTVQITDALGVSTTISPTFWMYPHISLASSATCYGNYGTGCTASLAISGGVPGSGASVSLVSVAPNKTANPPSNNPGMCWSNPPPSPPPSSPSAGGGYVTVTIPSRLINGYGAIWTVVVTSTDLCGAGTYCATNQGTFTIGVQCG